jgi:hypothetical protein
MSKEEKNGFFGELKNQIIAGVGVILTTLGTVFIDEVKTIVGIGGDEEEIVETVKQENNQTVNVTGPEIVINIPEQKKDTVVKKIYVAPKPKPKEKEDLDW